MPYSINKKSYDRFASTGLNPVVLVPSLRMQEASIDVAPRQTSWRPGVVPSVDYVTLRADAEDDAAGLQVMWKTKLLDFKVWTPSQAHLVDRFLVFFVSGLIHRIILKMQSGREEAEEKIRAINNAYVAWLHLSSQRIILIYAMVVHL